MSSALLITNANGLDLDQDQFCKLFMSNETKIILMNTSEYKHIVLFVGHRHTVQTMIRSSLLAYRMFNENLKKIPPSAPKFGYRLFLLIREGTFIRFQWGQVRINEPGTSEVSYCD